MSRSNFYGVSYSVRSLRPAARKPGTCRVSTARRSLGCLTLALSSKPRQFGSSEFLQTLDAGSCGSPDAFRRFHPKAKSQPSLAFRLAAHPGT